MSDIPSTLSALDLRVHGDPVVVDLSDVQRQTTAGGVMDPVSLTVVCDSAPLEAEIAELRERIDRAPAYLRWMALQIFESVEHSVELVQVDRNDRAAIRAGELRLLPQLSERLRLLVLALRAHEGEGESGVLFE